MIRKWKWLELHLHVHVPCCPSSPCRQTCLTVCLRPVSANQRRANQKARAHTLCQAANETHVLTRWIAYSIWICFFTMHFPVHVHLISSGISDGNCLTCSANGCPMSRLYVKALHYTYLFTYIYICTVTSCQCGKSMWVCKSISLSFSPCSYLLWWNLNVFSFAYVCLLFGFFSSFPPPLPIMFFNPIGRSQREWAG